MNKGCFKKGNIPWNKDTKGLMKENKTSWKKGQKAGEKNNTWKGGLQKHKDCYYLYLGVGKRVRRARYLYEKAFGEIPQGYVIVHLDGDCYNDDLFNLVAMSRANLIKFNKKML